MSEDARGSSHAQRTFRGGWEALQNPNVRRVLIFCFVNGACFSLWLSQVFQVLISRKFGDTTVGWLSATSCTAQLAGAAIAGLSDDLPRQTIIRLGAFSGIMAVALSIYAVSLLQVHIFFFASVLWGMFSGLASTGVEALFADSVETGRRDFAYNLKWANQTLCECIGSATSLLMLVKLGNEWNLGSMKTLIYTGVSLHPIAHVLLFTLKDKYVLDENTTGHLPQCAVVADDTDAPDFNTKTELSPETSEPFMGSKEGLDSPRQPLVSETGIKSVAPSSFSVMSRSLTSAGATVLQHEAIIAQSAMRSAQKQHEYIEAQERRNPAARLVASVWHHATKLCEWSTVPYLLCLSDFLVAFGSGMTMRYIPLFFVNDYHVTPVLLMGTSIASSIATAALSFLVRYMGERFVSRVVSAFSARFIGTTLLLLMGVTHFRLSILVPMFVLRSALMNCTTGVTRSVIMDCVPKSSRAKWSALESFAAFSWAGSAVIGGYTADAKGYQFTFLITSMVHYVGMCVLVPAMYGVREVERAKRERWWNERAEEKEWKKSLRRLRSTGTASVLAEEEGCEEKDQLLGSDRATPQ
ncbi:hypothetical protein MOQ_005826 [Trypanosoma cruzi marinkellei]|uniref:Major facilitator superfamily (MFS) profile domain-containing protein n=1 Tax=Trypanosoma cruzi marinkellei TaxID=85056 RepID=K2MTE7_TRYCR|nr:hypothetical protein MOQ_005826 [Trypanosoma cruzi marinkellei]